MFTKRNTIQRSLVLEAVNKLKCHATADEIYQEVTREHPNISKGTVYRNLNQLSDSGEIRKIETPGGADRFDHRCHDHYHVKCLRCGRVFDVDMDCLLYTSKTKTVFHRCLFHKKGKCFKAFTCRCVNMVQSLNY